MNKGGTIIRLVDVAMIILFGFIIISRLKMEEIKLPSTAKPPKTKTEKYVLKVKIFRDQGKNVDRFILIDNGNELGYFDSITELEPVLVKKDNYYNAKNVQLIILIEPDDDSIIQHTVDMLDLCTKHNILKNINYASLEL